MGQMSVNLPASLRSTTMLLRTLSADQDSALKRLASGQKINSSIEGPQQFFAARSLDQRAGDLDGLKSGMAQAISIIQAASTGVASVKSMLDQARGLTSVALSTLDNTPGAIAMRRDLAEQFDVILSQIDEIVGDSAYGGKNLLRARPASYAATDDSLRTANEITGTEKVSVSSVTGANNYRIHVTGSGAISGDAGDLIAVQEKLGLAQLTVGGLNSEFGGSLDGLEFELRGTPGRDATLVVLDGHESWTTDISQADLVTSAESGTQIKLSHTFGSGAEIGMVIDGQTMRDALQPVGLVKASIQRNVDLHITVTNNQGVTETRSADTQDDAVRLRAGGNSFRFSDGTVRVKINPATIQGAAQTQGGLFGDRGPFEAAILTSAVLTEDHKDTKLRLEVEKAGFGAGNTILNQYAGADATWSRIDLTAPSGDVTLGGTADDNSRINLGMDASLLHGRTSSGVFLVNRSAGAGGLTTVADGDYDAGEFANPFLRDWQQSTTLHLVYGATTNGERSFTLTDGLGGSVTGTLEDKGDGQPSVVTMRGGVNDGATIGLFHKDGSAGARDIDLFVGLTSYATADDAASAAAAGFDDIQDWTGFQSDTAVSVSIGAANSGGVGQRTLSINQTTIDGGITASENLLVSNGVINDFSYTLTGGPNAGARIRLDLPASASTLDYRVAAMEATVGGADLLIRSYSNGESASIATEQVSVATPENDLTVNFNPNGSSSMTVKAVNVGSGPLGLGIDLASNQWRDRSDVSLAINDLARADTRLQSALHGLEVNMDILRSRDTYTSEFSNVLREGARRLVASDENEESAKVLTANVRTQLASIMVSLMTQQQQRILGLF